MTILAVILMFLGIPAVVDAVVYLYAVRQYKLHPEKERSYRFELLDLIYRHKYASILSIALGVVCIAASIMIFLFDHS